MTLIIIALSCVAPASQASEDSLRSLALAEADALCVRNHANPELVLSAAKAAGWTDPGKPGGVLGQLGMTPEPGLRLKTIGDDVLSLRAQRKDEATALGKFTINICSVTDEGGGSRDLRAVMARRFTATPRQADAQGSFWAYVLGERNRQIPSASRAQDEQFLKSGKTVVTMGWAASPTSRSVIYSEMRLVRDGGQ